MWDTIANIKTVVKYLLGTLLPDNVTQSVSGRITMDVETIAELSYLINRSSYVDYNDEILLCVDSRIFNKQGNTNQL